MENALLRNAANLQDLHDESHQNFRKMIRYRWLSWPGEFVTSVTDNFSSKNGEISGLLQCKNLTIFSCVEQYLFSFRSSLHQVQPRLPTTQSSCYTSEKIRQGANTYPDYFPTLRQGEEQRTRHATSVKH